MNSFLSGADSSQDNFLVLHSKPSISVIARYVFGPRIVVRCLETLTSLVLSLSYKRTSQPTPPSSKAIHADPASTHPPPNAADSRSLEGSPPSISATANRSAVKSLVP